MTLNQQRIARAICKQGAYQLLRSPGYVHYTMGSARWSPISRHKLVGHPIMPFYGDCSSTVTWLLWNALHIRFGMGDVVNGLNWKGGYTGTLAQHGVRVSGRPGTRRVGDLVLYGPAPTYEHVAMVIAPNHVMSHGSEGGPYYASIYYRSDVGEFRRYIR